MAAAKKGLGKSFDSLLGENKTDKKQSILIDERKKELKQQIATGEVSSIEIGEIDPNYEQPRKNFDQQSLK